MKKNGTTEYYEEIETTKEYDGYFCSVSEAITISNTGKYMRLKNVSQIHQWAKNDGVSRWNSESIMCHAITGYCACLKWYGDSGYIGAKKRPDAVKKNKSGKNIRYIINRRP